MNRETQQLQRSNFYLCLILFTFSFFLFTFNPVHAGLITHAPNYVGLTSGLIGFWSFDATTMGTTSALDRSGQGNNGWLVNGPEKTLGRIGQAVDIDGINDYVALANDSRDSDTQGTVSAWVKPVATSGEQSVLISTTSGNDSKLFSLGINNATMYIQAYDIVENDYVLSPSDLKAGIWNHVVYVSTGSSWLMYINGARVNVSVSLGSNSGRWFNYVSAGTQNYRMGYLNATFPKRLKGSIDDVRIYNRALSADEIKRLYNIGGTLKVNTTLSNNALTNGLVGHWSFDAATMGTTSALDRSGQNNHGWLINGPVKTIGKIGQALEFDGSNDYVNAGDISNADGGTKFTASLWARQTALAVNSAMIVKWDFQTQGSWAMQTDNTDSTKFRVFIADSLTSSGSSAIDSPSGVWTAGVWHHVMFVYDGTQGTAADRCKLYLDGVQLTVTNSVGTVPTSMQASTATVKIGKFGGTLNRYWNGSIDDVRIYNRALSPDEIKRLYNIGGTLKLNTTLSNNSLTNGLVGHWTFDAKTMGTTSALDRSGQNNHGWLINGPAKTLGRIGQALELDGSNDYVSVGDPASLDFGTGDFTISAWVRIDSLLGAFQAIVSKGTGGNVGYMMEVSSGNKFGCRIRVSGGANQAVNASADAITQSWQHITCVYDRDDKLYLYINGTQIASAAVDTASVSSAVDFRIGAQYLDQWYVDGLIDDVRIYNRALSSDEIKRLYNLGR